MHGMRRPADETMQYFYGHQVASLAPRHDEAPDDEEGSVKGSELWAMRRDRSRTSCAPYRLTGASGKGAREASEARCADDGIALAVFLRILQHTNQNSSAHEP